MLPDATLTFLGDVACPDELVPRLEQVRDLPFGSTVINLEGALCPAEQVPSIPTRALYNSTRILPTLARWNVRAATLANNHICDLRQPLSRTAGLLGSAGIAAFGAGDDLGEAARPCVLEVAGSEVLLLAFNWEVIPWRSAGRRRGGANPLDPPWVLDCVRRAVAENSRARIVVVFHWNFELERYPIPAQRQLAFDVIDAGAAAIIGHHPHCAQGIEWHGGRPIVYSLGDWFLPQGDFFGHRIYLPEYTYRQLAFEWDPVQGASKCHWFDYDRREHSLRHLSSEDAHRSAIAQALTPFAGLDHRDYVRWFAEHRVKSKGLPLYRDYRHGARNRLRDWYSIGRGLVVRTATAWNLRQRSAV